METGHVKRERPVVRRMGREKSGQAGAVAVRRGAVGGVSSCSKGSALGEQGELLPAASVAVAEMKVVRLAGTVIAMSKA